jgi:hypothetical protein
MKKIVLPFLVIVFALVAFTNVDNCSVSYKGIYAFKLDNEHSAILRFYEDGTVLASTSVNDYLDVFTWFHKENKDMVLTGKYKIKKCSIKFEVTGATGTQKYEGTIRGETLEVKLTDEATKKTATRAYTYFPLGL